MINRDSPRAVRLRRLLVGCSLPAVLLAGASPALAQEPISPPKPDTADIVVTGQRTAELRALQLKQRADNIVETLVADDVGKLPDQNVAEAVKRLPGITVANDQGEGRYVIIRGINPSLVNVTVNGQTQPAPEPDGRQVKLDDIPSSLISAVTVTKSLTPDQDGNAIGGTVDIRTLSAFDRRDSFFAGARGEVGRYDLNGKHPYEGDAQVGGRFGPNQEFGAVASFSYSRRPIESENFQGTTNFPAGRPDQYGLRDYNLVRERTGLVLNLDYHPSPDVKLYLRGTYSKFSDNEARDQNRVDSICYYGSTTPCGFTTPPADPDSFRGRPSILIRRRLEDDNTKSASGGGIFNVGGGKLEASAAYARSIKDDPLRSEFNFRGSATGSNSVTGTYDLTTSPPLFTVTPSFATTYSLNTVNYDIRHAQEDLWQARLDYTLPVAIGRDSSIKVGAKYLDRHKTNDRQFQQFGVAGGKTFTAANASFVGDTDFYDGMYAFGPRIDYDAAQAYAVANGVLGQNASNRTSSTNNSLVNDYDVRERIWAGYAMATIRSGGLTIIPGVRIEHTEDETKAKLITATSTPTDDYNSFGEKSYTNVLPGVNLKYEVSRDLMFRAAVTTAIGRPNYPDLAPYVSIDTTTSPVTVTQGNPDLKPYKAWNLDAAIEHYFPNQGIVAVGAFYKHLDNPIYTQGLLVSNGTFAGQTFASAQVNQPLNADKATLYGLEANVIYQFTLLPGALGGFGVSGNATWVKGHGRGLLARSGNFPLFFQSKYSGTAQLTYEKYGFTGRLAYTYRSRYLDTLGASAASDQYTDNNGQLDARIGYQIIPQAEVYLAASNLTDAPWRRFIGVKPQLVERERYGPAYRIGLQIKI